MAACPLCRQRKGKRACPAKGELICAACCGAKRRIEIDCPEDCVWLGAHAGAWEGRATERTRDLRRLAPHLERLSDAQARLLFLSLVGVTALRGRRRDLDDELLLEATAADELMITTMVYDPADRLASFTLVAAQARAPQPATAP